MGHDSWYLIELRHVASVTHRENWVLQDNGDTAPAKTNTQRTERCNDMRRTQAGLIVSPAIQNSLGTSRSRHNSKDRKERSSATISFSEWIESLNREILDNAVVAKSGSSISLTPKPDIRSDPQALPSDSRSHNLSPKDISQYYPPISFLVYQVHFYHHASLV